MLDWSFMNAVILFWKMSFSLGYRMNYICQVHNQRYDGHWVTWSRSWTVKGTVVFDNLVWAEQKSQLRSFRCLNSLNAGTISSFHHHFSSFQPLLFCCPPWKIQKVHDRLEILQQYKYRQHSDAIVIGLPEYDETIN